MHNVRPRDAPQLDVYFLYVFVVDPAEIELDFALDRTAGDMDSTKEANGYRRYRWSHRQLRKQMGGELLTFRRFLQESS